MSGHTPGPWILIPARPDEEIEGAFADFAMISGANGDPVCTFGDWGGSGTMFENEADHALIAASPALLEALTPFAKAAEIYQSHVASFDVSGETSAERRFSEGEREDTAREAAAEYLAGLSLEVLLAARSALALASDTQPQSDETGHD